MIYIFLVSQLSAGKSKSVIDKIIRVVVRKPERSFFFSFFILFIFFFIFMFHFVYFIFFLLEPKRSTFRTFCYVMKVAVICEVIVRQGIVRQGIVTQLTMRLYFTPRHLQVIVHYLRKRFRKSGSNPRIPNFLCVAYATVHRTTRFGVWKREAAAKIDRI